MTSAAAQRSWRSRCRYMPVGVHMAVVDPTVGGDRRGGRAPAGRRAHARRPRQRPAVAGGRVGGGVVQAVEISQSRWRLEPVSATFHGRDIFAPVAAHLAAGEPFDQAGEPLDPALLVRLETPRARTEGGALVASRQHRRSLRQRAACGRAGGPLRSRRGARRPLRVSAGVGRVCTRRAMGAHSATWTRAS